MRRVVIALVIVIAGALFLSRNALLHRGASGGPNVLMSVALTIGANTDSYASDGHTALSAAAAAGQTTAVKRLIDAGANVNKGHRDTGATPLMYAAESGDETIVDQLLAAGASVSDRDKEDRTAYWYAIQNHHSSVARKVFHVRTVDVTLPPPSGPASASDQWVDGKPPNYVEPAVTASSPLVITDTRGWTRVGPNQYVKSVSREEAQRLDAEKRRQQDDARAEAARQMDAKKPPR